MAASLPRSESRPAIVIMGVSGCGKTTVGTKLSAALGLRFIDGDALHAPEAVAKMARGEPLTDDDRWPWLDRVGAALRDEAADPAGLIVACSALKRRYRDRIRAAVGPSLRFLYLEADHALIAARVAGRKNHFMPASLVDSQFAALEDPRGEPDVVTVAADANLRTGLDKIIARLRAPIQARSGAGEPA